MWNAVLAGTTAAVIAASSLVLAQRMPDRDGGQPSAVVAGPSLVVAQQMAGRDGDPRWHPSAEDRSAFTDARIAALKAGTQAYTRAGEKLACLRGRDPRHDQGPCRPHGRARKRATPSRSSRASTPARRSPRHGSGGSEETRRR